MIRTEKGELVCYCTECGHPEYGGTQEFVEFVAELKANGWRIVKDGDSWDHFCPDCEAD